MDSGSEDHFGQYNLQPPQDFICTDMDPTKVLATDTVSPEFLDAQSAPDPIVSQENLPLDQRDDPGIKETDEHDKPSTLTPNTQPLSFTQESAWDRIVEFSQLVDIPNFIPPKTPRFFLELFSGERHHLSSHVLTIGCRTLQPLDILIDNTMDILNDECYLSILRLISTKRIGSILAAPPCTEYSLLKLKQPGPLPCRTPENMDQPLYDSPECIHRFVSSREIMSRTTTILHVNHIHGGYSTMEQPLHAMTWDEEFIRQARKDFLTESAIISHCQVAEKDQTLLNKHWLFVSNIPDFHHAELQCTCSNTHASFAGNLEPDGSYSSRLTAEYTTPMAEHLARFLRLECVDTPNVKDFIPWNGIFSDLPQRPPANFHHIPDGGGLVSTARWPLPFKSDVFFSLRKRLEQVAVDFKLPKIVPAHIQTHSTSSPFSSEVMRATEQVFHDFSQQCGLDIDDSISPGQPFRLSILYQLATLMNDPDIQLIPLLETGVDLGVDTLIPSSGTWPQKLHSAAQHLDEGSFHSFEENWLSADSDPDTLEKLIQQEISDGFVLELGDLQTASEKFGDKLAIGKLGIARQQPSKPRLVLDSTVSGLNPLSQQAIQEKCTYPKLSDLQQCVPPSLYTPCKLLNLDVKSAHKRIKVKPEHQGLLAFQFRDIIYHYQVLHFGGTCSAYYWSRLSAIFLRFFHHFLYVFHFGLVFVDDFIFGLDSVAAPLQTSTLLLCIAYLNIPLSWHKLELGYHITWIGWDIDTWSDTITLPQDKMHKILQNISELKTSGKFKRSLLESVTGNILWISGIFPFLRWYLGVFYTILSRPGFQLVRLNKEQISRVPALLNDHGQLTDLLQRPYVPQGSILARMGKFQFHSGELAQFKQSCFDLNFAWTSFWNCRSNRVQVLEEEALIFQHLFSSLQQSIPRTTLSQNRRIPLQAGADAFASAREFGLGAWITFPARDCWISMIGNTSDLPDIFHTGNLQRHIVSFETVAQCLILIMFNRSGLRGADFLIQSKLDNQASEAIIAQGFTQLPIPLSLMRALQKLTYDSTISFLPYRCSSADNKRADDLSRG